jgi:hypothetical protein
MRRRRQVVPEALAAFGGEHAIDASAINDYFAPPSARWTNKTGASPVNALTLVGTADGATARHVVSCLYRQYSS